MEIPQEGKYVCKLNAQAVIYEAQTGSLCLAAPCVMVDSGFTFKHTMTLVKGDGTIQTKTTETLKQVFAWDGIDPFWLMDNSADGGTLREIEFEITGGPQQSDKGSTYFKSQWLNPIGGGMNTPEAANRQSVLAKYGSKFRALAGTPAPKPAAPAAPKPPTAPPPPPTAPNIPGHSVAPATMEEAWDAHCKANFGMNAPEMETKWFAALKSMFPNKTNTDLKPLDWGKLKAALEDNITF